MSKKVEVFLFKSVRLKVEMFLEYSNIERRIVDVFLCGEKMMEKDRWKEKKIRKNLSGVAGIFSEFLIEI